MFRIYYRKLYVKIFQAVNPNLNRTGQEWSAKQQKYGIFFSHLHQILPLGFNAFSMIYLSAEDLRP
jgi:hypothetical protein